MLSNQECQPASQARFSYQAVDIRWLRRRLSWFCHPQMLTNHIRWAALYADRLEQHHHSRPLWLKYQHCINLSAVMLICKDVPFENAHPLWKIYVSDSQQRTKKCFRKIFFGIICYKQASMLDRVLIEKGFTSGAMPKIKIIFWPFLGCGRGSTQVSSHDKENS